MARLIDADKTMDELRDYADRKCANGYMDTANGILSAVNYIRNNVKRVDAVEVVRCKDCKHWFEDVAGCTDFVGRCEWANYMVGAVGYCVYGERKDGDGNG